VPRASDGGSLGNRHIAPSARVPSQVPAAIGRDPGGDADGGGTRRRGLGETLTETQAVTDAAREAITRTRALRDELLVLASHDIKNAVGILDSALGMSAEMPEQAASMQGMMRRATHRLAILVQALVDVDLLQRDAMPLQPAEISWNAIATPVVDGALGIADTKDVTLASRGDLAARVACDAVLVQRMVGALVEYAIANAPAKSAVDVEGVRVDADASASASCIAAVPSAP
jgi:K+-sensing histidine kinase KdpD